MDKTNNSNNKGKRRQKNKTTYLKIMETKKTPQRYTNFDGEPIE